MAKKTGEEDRVEAVWKRAARREAADKREAAALDAVGKADKKTRKTLYDYNREKPTAERAAVGVFEVVDPARFGDSDRKGEKMLMDWKARAGGAGEMYARKQISDREMAAAVKLCELYELSQTAQLSGVWKVDLTEGGSENSVARLRAAADAAGAFQYAMNSLSRTARILVLNRVVYGTPMEEVVQLLSVRHRLGAISVRKRCEKAATLLAEGLDHLADFFGLAGA